MAVSLFKALIGLELKRKSLMDAPKEDGANSLNIVSSRKALPSKASAKPANDDENREMRAADTKCEVSKSDVGSGHDVGIDQYLAAAATLAEAFGCDDVARYMVDVPDCAHWSDAKKWELHCAIMNYMTYAHCARHLTTAAGPPSDPHACVALWFYPHRTIENPLIMFSSGLWRLTYKLSSHGRKRAFREFFPLLAKTKSDVLGSRSKDCYYLVYIGTKPAFRGMGLAKQLIQEAAAKADKEGKVMYLESSNVRNLKLYRSLGFEVKKRIVLPSLTPQGGQVAMDIMTREPGGLLSMEAVDSGVAMSDGESRERSETSKPAGMGRPIVKEESEPEG